MNTTYVHGYSDKETLRLEDQASTLTELLHADTIFPQGGSVLEVGCGVGSQTVTIARKNANAFFTSVDVSEKSLEQVRRKIAHAGLDNVRFQQANIFDLPFDPESFDHVFVCFVLEHLRNPVDCLSCLERVLRPGGSIIVIEGDHGSAYFHGQQRSAAAHPVSGGFTVKRGRKRIDRETTVSSAHEIGIH